MKCKKIIATTIASLFLLTSFSGCAKEVRDDEELDETTESQETTTIEESEESEETSDTWVLETSYEEQDNTIVFKKSTFPRLDGSTSMVPLGIGLKQALLDMTYDEAANETYFNKTTNSFYQLMDGQSDLLLVANPNPVVFDAMAEANFEYEMEEIAVEGLVFMVNSSNPIESLTIDQIRGIYTGEITNWSEVGGLDMPIQAFQRNETSGSQVMMRDTVMGDTPMVEVQTEMVAAEMDDLIEAVRGYDNSSNAIGYTVYYYAANMNMADGLKIIQVEGVTPSEQTLSDSTYPLLSHYYAVKAAKANTMTNVLFDWLVSEDGKTLLSLLGYVPVS